MSLVEQQLESGGGADSSDLQQLKSDLSELISLTQGELTSGSQTIVISLVLQLCAATIMVNLPLAYLTVADSLLDIKKQKLLLIFQGSAASPSDPPPLSSSTSSSSSSYSSTTLSCTLPTTQSEVVYSSESAHQLEREVETKEEGEEGEDDFQGTRCQAPLKEVF